MLDTNALLSTLLFPSQKMNALIERIDPKYQLVLSSFIVDEFTNVVHLKFPDSVRPQGSFGYHSPAQGPLIQPNHIQTVALS